MHTPICVVGSYVQDLSFKTHQFPSPGSTVLGSFFTGPGGKGSNQAIASKRAGVDTCFISALGDDAFAEVARSFHAHEQVDARWLTVADCSTGAASIVVDHTGQNAIVVAPGACERLIPEFVKENFPEKTRIVVTQLETEPQASLQALEWGRENGAITILNPAPMRRDFPPELLHKVDIIIPNESEFMQLLSLVNADTASGLTEAALQKRVGEQLHELCQQLKIDTVLLTMGSGGVFLSESSGYRHYPVLEGVEVVDTTGAGDAFVGGFAAGMVLWDGDLHQAIRHAIVVGGLSVTRYGTAPAMPKEQEIRRMLALYPLD